MRKRRYGRSGRVRLRSLIGWDSLSIGIGRTGRELPDPVFIEPSLPIALQIESDKSKPECRELTGDLFPDALLNGEGHLPCGELDPRDFMMVADPEFSESQSAQHLF